MHYSFKQNGFSRKIYTFWWYQGWILQWVAINCSCIHCKWMHVCIAHVACFLEYDFLSVLKCIFVYIVEKIFPILQANTCKYLNVTQTIWIKYKHCKQIKRFSLNYIVVFIQKNLPYFIFEPSLPYFLRHFTRNATYYIPQPVHVFHFFIK